MAKLKRKTEDEKITLVNQILEDRKDMGLTSALKKAKVSDATFYKWKKIFNKPKKLSKTKKKLDKNPNLVTIPLDMEGIQPVVVLIGPSDKINSALGLLAQIYRG